MHRSITTAVAAGLVAMLLPAVPASANGPEQTFVTNKPTLNPGNQTRSVSCGRSWEAVEAEVERPAPVDLSSSHQGVLPYVWEVRFFNNSSASQTVKVTVRCIRQLPTRGSGQPVVLKEKSAPLAADQTIAESVTCPDGTVPGGIGWSANKAGPSTDPPTANPAFQWRRISESANTDSVRVESFASFKFDFVLQASCLHKAVKVGGQPAVLKIGTVPGSVAVQPGEDKRYAPNCPAGDVPIVTEFGLVQGDLYVFPFVVPMTVRANPDEIYNGTSVPKMVNQEADCLKYQIL
jgi:hypothetical protein